MSDIRCGPGDGGMRILMVGDERGSRVKLDAGLIVAVLKNN